MKMILYGAALSLVIVEPGTANASEICTYIEVSNDFWDAKGSFLNGKPIDMVRKK